MANILFSGVPTLQAVLMLAAVTFLVVSIRSAWR